MNVFTDMTKLPIIQDLVITIGSFDGVHKGHKQLLQTIQDLADDTNGQSGLITFHPHPRLVLQPDQNNAIKLLTTLEEKIQRLKEAGLQNLFIVPFSVDFANLSPQEYLKQFLIELFHPSYLVIGYDHKFGKGRKGDFQLLKDNAKQYGYRLQKIDKQSIETITYSSTNIRNYLQKGDIKNANHLLGYTYFIEGIVVHGEKRGRQIGFPTANIQVNHEHKLVPLKGVYAVTIQVDELEYNGMLNIGNRPTFHGLNNSIEVHIFNFSAVIYGKRVKIKFIDRLRDEKTFKSVVDLQAQLQQDKQKALKVLHL